MPTISTLALASNQSPMVEGGAETTVFRSLSLTSGIANNADDITVMTIPAGCRLTHIEINVSATLGTSCTLQGRLGSTALTPATTAGGASFVQRNAFPPATLTSATAINLLVGGANITAAATVQVLVKYVRV